MPHAPERIWGVRSDGERIHVAASLKLIEVLWHRMMHIDGPFRRLYCRSIALNRGVTKCWTARSWCIEAPAKQPTKRASKFPRIHCRRTQLTDRVERGRLVNGMLQITEPCSIASMVFKVTSAAFYDSIYRHSIHPTGVPLQVTGWLKPNLISIWQCLDITNNNKRRCGLGEL